MERKEKPPERAVLFYVRIGSNRSFYAFCASARVQNIMLSISR